MIGAGLVAGGDLPRRGGDLSYCAALHALRQVHLCDLLPLAARVSGINVERHIVLVYTLAAGLSGLAGIVQTARAISGQVGVGFELDAIAAAVIGGTSLSGGVGRLTGAVIGTVILGVRPPASRS